MWALGTKQNDTDQIPAAVAAVAASDVDVALVFVQDTYVGEQADRTDIALTYGQQELVKQVRTCAPPRFHSLACTDIHLAYGQLSWSW